MLLFNVKLGVNMKKLMCLFAICLIFVSCNSRKAGITIGICQLSNDQALDIARNNVIKALKEAGYEDGKNITIDYKNAQGEISNIFMILKEFTSKKVDLIITNPTPVMTAAAQSVKNIPIVYTVSFSPEQVSMANPPQNLCGAYDPLNIEDLVKIMKESMPGLTAIGNPYSPSEPNAQYAAKKLKSICEKYGITVYQAGVSSTNDIMQVVQSLTNKNIQAIVVVADNAIYSGLNTVASIANDKKLPLIVSDPSQAEKGACIGIGVSFEDWGYESGKLAVQVLKGKKPSEIGHVSIQKETLLYNKKAAKLQGFTLATQYLKRVTKIIE